MTSILIHATGHAGGDINPMVAVALGLRAYGCDVTVLTDPDAEPLFTALGLPVVATTDAWEVGPAVKAALEASATLPEGRRAAAVRDHVARWADNLRPTARQLLDRLRPDILITSFFGTAIGSLLHAESGAPWCAINTTFYIGPEPPRPLERDFSARAADVFRYSVIPYLAEASLVLHATDPLFDYDHRGLPVNNHYTGPLIWEAPGAVPEFVSAPGDPFILVTLSSLRQDDVPLARDALLAMEGAPYRLLATLGLGHEISEIARVPGNAHVEQYVPHSAVLPQSVLLVAHAGHGSVMKALSFGVPMVLVPWSRDQFGVAARAEHLGVAVVLPKEQLAVRTMAAAIDKVLSDPSYKQAATAAAKRLREEDPIATAVELITGLVNVS